jgi:hypothetical protein
MGLTWDADVTVTCYPNLGGIQTIPCFWNYKETTLSPICTSFIDVNQAYDVVMCLKTGNLARST